MRWLVPLLAGLLTLASCRDRDSPPSSARSQPIPPSPNPAAPRPPLPRAFPLPPAFWVWNRHPPLDHEALGELALHPRVELYWQIIDLPDEAVIGGTTSTSSLRLTPERRAIPVIRLKAGARTLDDPDLRQRIRHAWAPFSAPGPEAWPALQLDYDCPASRLGDYAALLESLRGELKLRTLSITALASWIGARDFDTLAGAVDEMMPMFYDLAADAPADVVRGTPRPMLDEETLRWIGKWKACPVRWRAGLPNFQRVSLFEPDGTLVGHFQEAVAERLALHPAVAFVPGSPRATQRFRVLADGTLSGIRIRAGQHLVWRMPEEKMLVRAIAAARESGAAGTIWFAHPASAPRPLHSVGHLAALQRGETPPTELRVTVDARGTLELHNAGEADLWPRPADSPWKLVLEADAPGRFGMLEPFDFHAVDAPGSSPARPQLARRIVLEFHSLRARESLRTGTRFIRNPEAGPPDWRILPQP